MNRRFLICWMLLLSAAAYSQPVEIKTWTFRQSGKNKIYQGADRIDLLHDLHTNDLLPDPRYIIADSITNWVENEDWIYETEVSCNDPGNVGTLVLDRADTYTSVYLNNEKLGSTDNAFIRREFDVSGKMRKGKNTLRIEFFSPVKHDAPKAAAEKFRYPADSDKHPLKTSVYTRKPAWHFGWDFAPRMIRFGVENIYFTSVVKSNALDVSDFYLKQFQIKGTMGYVELVMEIKRDRPAQVDLVPFCAATNGTASAIPDTLHFNLASGTNEIVIPVEIADPRRWWPAGMGPHDFYTCWFATRIDNGEWHLTTFVRPGDPDPGNMRFALRTVELRQERDSIGTSFRFYVNNQPMFVTGFNVIGDVLDHPEEFAAFPALNMIRIWGGGSYGSDALYNYCDRNGILVWQDFAFANTMYPSDSGFLSNVKHEAQFQVKRLRNHPSLALFCGNNEVEVAWKNWGWQKTYKYNKKEQAQLESGYNLLFKTLLPEVVRKYAPEIHYLSSSPISNWGKKEDFNHGDNHFWGVYHGEMPFEAYDTLVPRFASEYGMQSFPSSGLVNKTAGRAVTDISDPVIREMQKSYKGNGLLYRYMERYGLPKPADVLQFTENTQKLQAMAMRRAIESHMLQSARCSGTLLWQYNDVAPTASWSLVDIDGNKKQAWYAVRDKFAPMTLITRLENDSLKVWIFRNSTDAAQYGINTVYINAADGAGNVLNTEYLQFGMLDAGLNLIGVKPLALLNKNHPDHIDVTMVVNAMEGASLRETSRIDLNEIKSKPDQQK